MSSGAEGSGGLGAATRVVVMPDEIDIANADDVARELHAALTPGTGLLIVDMSVTTFCDTAGLRAVTQAYQQAQALGAELRLVTAAPGLLRVLAVTALDTVLPVYPRLEEALAAPAGRTSRPR